MLKPGDIILPKLISEDGKLIIKKFILPDYFKDWDPNNCTFFMRNLIELSRAGNDPAILYRFSFGLCESEPYLQECLEEALEALSGSSNFYYELLQAIQIRLAECGHEYRNVRYIFAHDYSNKWWSNKIIYNGQEVSGDTLRKIIGYFDYLDYLKGHHYCKEFVDKNMDKIEKIKEAGVPTKNYISWALQMISKE